LWRRKREIKIVEKEAGNLILEEEEENKNYGEGGGR